MPSQALLSTLLWLGMAVAALSLPTRTAEALLPPSGNGGEECNRTCGNVDIPYPFGFGPDHCAMSLAYNLSCNDTGNGILKPFLATTVEVLGISLQRGQIRVMNFVSSYCYDAVSEKMNYNRWWWNLTGTAYMLSHTDNRFRAIGCRTLAFIGNENDVGKYMTGCAAMCQLDDLTLLANGSCSGMGCCETAIPRGLQYYQVWFDDRWNTAAAIYSSSPCSFAVLMESSNFTFSTSYLNSMEFNNSNDGRVPMVLDWFIGDQKCEVARTEPGYACMGNNSECFNAAGGQGYICNCTQGFQGNPYVTGPDGCQDINECEDPIKYVCYGDCINRPGTFECFCPRGTRGNPYIESCQKESLPHRTRLAIGIFAGVLVCLVGFFAIEVVLHRRSIKRQALQRKRDQYFQQHGGQLLSQMLRVEGNDNVITFYEREDIVKATDNFNEANILGEGAQGKVYKATLAVDGIATVVAVKRCKEIDEKRKTEFLQELVILCRVSHPNIVKLLGCCLQLEAPVLVYEFARNETLQHLLHGRPRRLLLSLATRLRIAAESAKALAHLHSPPHPILHGDVKPANILLGDNYVVKVSDFGCSTIDDNTQVVPKGTLGYLDPEFLYDFQLTDKNDVYSFGVVLVELLTGKKPLVKERKNLTVMLHESMGNGTLAELLDADIAGEGSMRVIHQAAELASRCIAVPCETRPAMGQVAEELRRLSEQVPECSPPPQEFEGRGFTEMGTAMLYGYTTAESESTGFYRLESNAALSIEYAR